MSWTYDNWTQDDSVNFGFPYASSSVPAQADFSEVKSVMKLKQNQNFGFPFINEVSSIDYDNIKSVWKIKSNINFGFPYIANTLIFDDNKLNLMVGNTPVQRAYLDSELVWERDGINKIMTESFINMIHNNS